jgi:hypothetical protein
VVSSNSYFSSNILKGIKAALDVTYFLQYHLDKFISEKARTASVLNGLKSDPSWPTWLKVEFHDGAKYVCMVAHG